MSTTIQPTLLMGESVEVLGLNAVATLAFVVEEQRREDAAAARKLRGVTHWADLHRAEGVGAAHPELHGAVHRLKTHDRWTYRREPDGTLTWTSPLRRSYTVDHTGTTPHG